MMFSCCLCYFLCMTHFSFESFNYLCVFDYALSINMLSKIIHYTLIFNQTYSESYISKMWVSGYLTVYHQHLDDLVTHAWPMSSSVAVYSPCSVCPCLTSVMDRSTAVTGLMRLAAVSTNVVDKYIFTSQNSWKRLVQVQVEIVYWALYHIYIPCTCIFKHITT